MGLAHVLKDTSPLNIHNIYSNLGKYFIAWKFHGMEISHFRGRVKKNREIQIPQKMHFELNRKFKCREN